MQKPKLVIGYLMNGGTFTQSVRVPKVMDWIKHLEPPELIVFFQDLLELIPQLSSRKEDVETLEEFLDYWSELASETEADFEETHINLGDSEIAAKAVEMLWQSLADSVGAALQAGEFGIFGDDDDDDESDLTSPWLEILDELPERALMTQNRYIDPEPIEISEAQRDAHFALSISEVPFSIRVRNCLKRNNIETLRDIAGKTEKNYSCSRG